ncbi:DUF5522 domain-containing protein [Halobacteriovorax sp. GFR7]
MCERKQKSTEVRLKRMRKCCKYGCRHCPWGFKKRKS